MKPRVETLPQRQTKPKPTQGYLESLSGKNKCRDPKGLCVEKEKEKEVTELVGGHLNQIYIVNHLKILIINTCVCMSLCALHIRRDPRNPHTGICSPGTGVTLIVSNHMGIRSQAPGPL